MEYIVRFAARVPMQWLEYALCGACRKEKKSLITDFNIDRRIKKTCEKHVRETYEALSQIRQPYW
jgi:hypothetical protein